MDLLRQIWSYVSIAVLVAAVWVLAAYLPKCDRFGASSDFNALNGIEPYQSVRVDRTVGPEQLRRGDVVCYRPVPGQDVTFAYVAAIPGERVELSDRNVLVDGEPFERGRTPSQVLQRPTLVVPARHLFVIDDRHYLDSFGLGPIPYELVLGRAEVQ